MRKIVVHMQTTLDGRISNEAGLFWEPFPFGNLEMAYVNEAFRRADTWAMGRGMYQFVVPYWELVAAGQAPEAGGPITPPRQAFAELLQGMSKLVFSHSLADDPATARTVIAGDVGAELAALKAGPGKDITVSGGPETLAALAARPGLIDEYLLVIHPAVLCAGPRLFERLPGDLALRLVHAAVFDAGAIVARYQVLESA